MTKFKFALAAVLVLGLVAGALAQGRGQGMGGRMGMGPGGGMMGLLVRADVRRDLALTPEQVSRLDAIQAEAREKMMALREQFGEDRESAMQAMRSIQEEIQKKAEAVLNQDQKKRLREIFIQVNFVAAIMSEDIGKELGITAEQRNRIQALQEAQREAMREVRQRAQDGEIDQTEARAAMERNRKILEDKVREVLTPAQREKLETMKGRPFQADPSEGRGR